MKTLKQISLIALGIVMIFASISFAETARLGSDAQPSFNQTSSAYKTAAYTLTTSDSLVNFTATSANIVATLPTVESCLTGQRCSFKIQKKDATAYAIVVTPATGDTIGGESTRYLLSDEAYIIISAGPGKNWSVQYETPYIVEDHELGTYTTGIGSGGLVSTLTVSTTLTASACGNTYLIGTDALTIDLPATVANCVLRFVNSGAAGNNIMTINPATADNIWGTITLASSVVVIEDTAGDAIVNTKATSVKGDSITLIGDGADGWFILSSTGIWAEGS
jgi:hypothetical protein